MLKVLKELAEKGWKKGNAGPRSIETLVFVTKNTQNNAVKSLNQFSLLSLVDLPIRTVKFCDLTALLASLLSEKKHQNLIIPIGYLCVDFQSKEEGGIIC